ncbi:MAG: GUN4 domain-containing protein, partial [Pleurocapsa sp. MO_192.B19]|nr:GUN4 domain-containing protein [Pleurocapsa sp. MO_192.B19]
MLNQLLGGHYLVLQTLGKGGFAKTYIAKDLHRPGHPKCAVKYLRPASNDTTFLSIARRLFNKEAEILESLGQYDQIPRLLAYFEEDRKFYLVQEFIEGHTLGTELPRGQCWTENKVIQMLEDVLQILQFVHSYGVIHRDIKPNNLIRRHKDGRLVLIDFGAVKQVRNPSITSHEPLSQKTISIGTQGYIPTEQEQGEPRLNSDIYALGAIGIQALTGIHPLQLQKDTDDEIIWQDRAEVSDELAAILSKMVRYDFKKRYQSATEILEALEPLAHYYTPIQSTPDTKQVTPEVAFKPNLPKTKESLDVKHQDTEKDLELSQANIFVHLNKYRLSIGAGIAFVLVGIFAGYNYMTQMQSYFQAQGALKQIEMLNIDEEYQECIQQAQTFLKDYSDLHAEAKTLLNQCQQGQAETQLAEDRRREAQSKSENAIAENDRQVELKSDKGIDYTQLRNYLEAKKWKEADLETYNVMLEATEGGNLNKDSIRNFPCNDLKSINSLWQRYSNDRFGFSIQNQEYQNLGKSIESLGYKLGWRPEQWMTYDYLWEKFHANVPPGHLPARIFRQEVGAGRWYF